MNIILQANVEYTTQEEFTKARTSNKFTSKTVWGARRQGWISNGYFYFIDGKGSFLRIAV